MDQPEQTLVEHLREPVAYPHEVDAVAVRETHISWVFLTGTFAYKVKKPIRTGFLDFSTLQLRRHFCEEELRLNRRFAPQLYLAVVPITGRPAAPRVGGEGEPIEYAVKMRQFSEDNLLSRLLQDGKLTAARVAQLAAEVGEFHLFAPPVSAGKRYGTPGLVRQEAVDNLTILQQLLPPDCQADLPQLRRLTEERFESLKAVFQERRDSGFVRECHGDLHLGNLVVLDDRVTIFDGIEFNDEFRWIDVMSDAAFAMMDLMDRGHPRLAHQFLNRYLETTGDYAGLAVLSWYAIYRALVRAKVASIRASQEQQQRAGEAERLQTLDECASYLRLARDISARGRPALIITFGLSGSGKTTGTEPLIERLGAVRVRSDVERKRLFNLKASERSGSAVEKGIYSAAASLQTYDRLAGCARNVIDSGRVAVVDATFLKRSERERFRSLAGELNVPFAIVQFEGEIGELEQRLRARAQAARDASEATVDVLHAQLKSQEALTREERAHCRSVGELLAAGPGRVG